MPRMSPETQKKLGLNDQQADFDEFLQMDDTPAAREFAMKRGYKKAKKSPALEGLKKAKS